MSYITSEHNLMWDIGWQFCFLSYFLMGQKIRRWGECHKSNVLALLLCSGGFAVNVVLGCVNYQRGLYELPVDVIQFSKNPFSYAPLAPFEVIASCLIFAGFSVLEVKMDYSKLSGYTFLIYLIHMGVIDVIFVFIGDALLGNQVKETFSVFIISVLVFIISLFTAIVYKRIFMSLLEKTVSR